MRLALPALLTRVPIPTSILPFLIQASLIISFSHSIAASLRASLLSEPLDSLRSPFTLRLHRARTWSLQTSTMLPISTRICQPVLDSCATTSPMDLVWSVGLSNWDCAVAAPVLDQFDRRRTTHWRNIVREMGPRTGPRTSIGSPQAKLCFLEFSQSLKLTSSTIVLAVTPIEQPCWRSRRSVRKLVCTAKSLPGVSHAFSRVERDCEAFRSVNWC
jgi:hypothetical protein